jgi:uncharacterized protein YqeY
VTESELKTRLAGEMQEALKGRQTLRLGALRMLASAVQYREVELQHPLTDEEFVEVAGREVKRRREAAEAFAKAGRDDRASTEREEQAVLETYLPAGPSEAELEAMVDRAIAATGATGPGDMGKVMREVMGQAGGRLDGRAVQTLVRQRLG